MRTGCGKVGNPGRLRCLFCLHLVMLPDLVTGGGAQKSAAVQAVQGGLKRHSSLGAHTLPLRQSKSAAGAHPGSPGKTTITTRSGDFTPHHSADVFTGAILIHSSLTSLQSCLSQSQHHGFIND